MLHRIDGRLVNETDNHHLRPALSVSGFLRTTVWHARPRVNSLATVPKQLLGQQALRLIYQSSGSCSDFWDYRYDQKSCVEFCAGSPTHATGQSRSLGLA